MLDVVAPLVFGSASEASLCEKHCGRYLDIATGAERPPGQSVQEILKPGIYSLGGSQQSGYSPHPECHKTGWVHKVLVLTTRLKSISPTASMQLL